ncbi:cell wall metabolism sensor histidine kinase WalK [Thermoactinomyces sp. CICC 10523]|uniref:sensor histidine kinase n=1 Tax=Thermoactinomyces sp. CICC 10523 TaxID=2767428 RepID=UPI0018DB107D|nr:HAMP domain-containing sensor histidine kinase [Thermoactinomyces sp. CICC 10523]MBH8597665.1 HAMP domain-containing histidine kinase [Thermoactinomyces sp. CICC 10523]
MKRRLTGAFIGVACGMIGLAILFLLLEIRYHFSMYLREYPELDPGTVLLVYHLQQALVQSTLWTMIGTIALAVMISLYLAKRISAPLIKMKEVAERMKQGKWTSRIAVSGNDELAELGQALNHLTEELQKQEAFRKNLTADLAHELRTPLATLKSHMEAFEDGIWSPTPERLHACYEEIERLIHLVGDLEQLQGLDSPQFKLNRQPENLVEIIRQFLQTMETPFVQKKVNLKFAGEEAVVVSVDRYRFTQILFNLLSNALDFTPPEGTVTVRVTNREEQAIVVVEDTGMGIPAEEIPKVFERFYRGDRAGGRRKGTGIGLTIVKKLVEAHQGEICIESEEGRGTRVVLSLPK